MELSFEGEAAVRRARDLAERRGHLLCVGDHLAYSVLTGEGEWVEMVAGALPRDSMLGELNTRLSRLPAGNGLPSTWSSRDLKELKLSAEPYARLRTADSLGPVDLLLGYLATPRGSDLLVKVGASRDLVREAERALVGASESPPADVLESPSIEAPAREERETLARVEAPATRGGLLRSLGRDLTEEAVRGRLDPVAGRDVEIERVIEVLLRRTKRNPLLVGPPGTGKSAIVEGLAQRIAEGRMPERLREVRVIELTMSSLVAGTSGRGQFEERLERLVHELQEQGGRALLFLDEIHTLVGAGGSAGGMDAANILKPALARGTIVCIGATTDREYRRYIETDKALDRRFTLVEVSEPSDDAAIEMLRVLRPKLEAHSGLRVDDEALRAAVKLSRRYLWGRFLPDKACDLLDSAMAWLRGQMESQPEALRRLESEVFTLQSVVRGADDSQSSFADAALAHRLAEVESRLVPMRRQWMEEQSIGREMTALRSRLLDLRQKLDASRRTGDPLVAQQATTELAEVESGLAAREATMRERQAVGALLSWAVTADQVALAVQRQTGIPVGRLAGEERERVMRIGQVLRRHVVGQDEAVDAVADALQRSRAGVAKAGKPVGAFLFVGPTGVGKTYLAQVLARELYGREEALIRIDMSEYQDKSSATRLLGAPPGLVGYEEGGQLTEAIRRMPYAVVLFDEMEKAHDSILTLLLQLTDEGILTDGQGTRCDFRNALIVFTSNLGAAEIEEQVRRRPGTSPEERREAYMSALKGVLRHEFLGRLDTAIFRSLDGGAVGGLVQRELAQLAERVREARNIALGWTPALVSRAAGRYDPVFGARSVLAFLRHEVERSLAKAILQHEGSATSLIMDLDDTGQVVLREAGGGQ